MIVTCLTVSGFFAKSITVILFNSGKLFDSVAYCNWLLWHEFSPQDWYNASREVLSRSVVSKVQDSSLLFDKENVILNITMTFRQSLFWDTNPEKIDPKTHAKYIIERIMDLGNDDEVRWMWQEYPHTLLAEVADNSRVLHTSTRTLWKLLTQTN